MPQKMHGSCNKSTLVSTTTTSGCTDQISQMILQETPRNLDPENIVKDVTSRDYIFYSSQWFATVLLIFAPNLRREGARQGCRAYERDR